MGIPRVGFRVVVREFHFDTRARGQADRRGIEVLVLPVEVPVRNMDQRAFCAIGQNGIPEHFLADVVSVRDDAQDVYIHGHGEVVRHPVVPLSRRDVDSVGAEPDIQQMPPGFLIGEVEGHAG